jgi:hypothetical protein
LGEFLLSEYIGKNLLGDETRMHYDLLAEAASQRLEKACRKEKERLDPEPAVAVDISENNI